MRADQKAIIDVMNENARLRAALEEVERLEFACWADMNGRYEEATMAHWITNFDPREEDIYEAAIAATRAPVWIGKGNKLDPSGRGLWANSWPLDLPVFWETFRAMKYDAI